MNAPEGRSRSSSSIAARNGTAYLVPADGYRSLVETAYLLRSPENAAALRAGIAEAREGRAEAHELVR